MTWVADCNALINNNGFKTFKMKFEFGENLVLVVYLGLSLAIISTGQKA